MAMRATSPASYPMAQSLDRYTVRAVDSMRSSVSIVARLLSTSLNRWRSIRRPFLHGVHFPQLCVAHIAT